MHDEYATTTAGTEIGSYVNYLVCAGYPLQVNAPALQVLRGLEGNGSEWVLPSAKKDGHLVNLKDPWARIRKRAGIEDVRPHDIRHSFGSVGASLNTSLPVLGALLGHKVAATTQRYAHVQNNPARVASDQIGTHINALLNGARSDDANETE